MGFHQPQQLPFNLSCHNRQIISIGTAKKLHSVFNYTTSCRKPTLKQGFQANQADSRDVKSRKIAQPCPKVLSHPPTALSYEAHKATKDNTTGIVLPVLQPTPSNFIHLRLLVPTEFLRVLEIFLRAPTSNSQRKWTKQVRNVGAFSSPVVPWHPPPPALPEGVR